MLLETSCFHFLTSWEFNSTTLVMNYCSFCTWEPKYFHISSLHYVSRHVPGRPKLFSAACQFLQPIKIQGDTLKNEEIWTCWQVYELMDENVKWTHYINILKLWMEKQNKAKTYLLLYTSVTQTTTYLLKAENTRRKLSSNAKNYNTFYQSLTEPLLNKNERLSQTSLELN